MTKNLPNLGTKVLDAAQRFKRPGSPCPICGGAIRIQGASFCSDRCRKADSGQWMTGNYFMSSRASSQRIVANDDAFADPAY